MWPPYSTSYKRDIATFEVILEWPRRTQISDCCKDTCGKVGLENCKLYHRQKYPAERSFGKLDLKFWGQLFVTANRRFWLSNSLRLNSEIKFPSSHSINPTKSCKISTDMYCITSSIYRNPNKAHTLVFLCFFGDSSYVNHFNVHFWHLRFHRRGPQASSCAVAMAA